MSSRTDRILALVPLLLALTGCAGATGGIRLRDLSPAAAAAPAAPTVIGSGDLIAIRVWNSEQMASTQRVRADGTIALFFMDTLVVGGSTTAEVVAAITKRLDGVLVAPRVSVVVEESVASAISIIGEVNRPGTFVVHRSLRVLDALALAGGLGEFAHPDRILLQRGGPTAITIRLTYKELLRGSDRAAGLFVGPGDVLIVR